MPIYRKKPVEVKAIQVVFGKTSVDQITTLFKDLPLVDAHTESPFINTLEGRMYVSDGDYIIQGVQGEYYPCKPDIFEQTYELVSDEEGTE